MDIESARKILQKCAYCPTHFPPPDCTNGPMYRGGIEIINNTELYNLTPQEIRILDSSASRENAGLYGTLIDSLQTTQPRLAAIIWRQGMRQYWMWDYVKGGCNTVCSGCPNRVDMEKLIDGDEK